MDPAQLLRAREEKRALAEAKAAKKAEVVEAERQKRLIKLEKGRTPPAEMFNTIIHDLIHCCSQLNQKVCLRLTERCATILISIREEIEQADEVSSPKASPTLIGSPGTFHLPTPPSGPSPLPVASGSGKSIHSSPKIGSNLSPRASPRLGHAKLDASPKPNLDSQWGKELELPMERLIG